MKQCQVCKTEFQATREYDGGSTYTRKTCSIKCLSLLGSKIRKGRKMSNKFKKNLSITRLGENNPMWKGDKVGYGGLHLWMRKRLFKPKVCNECNQRAPYDLANISQEYKRELTDWEWLCRRCHMDKDGRINNLKSQQWNVKFVR